MRLRIGPGDPRVHASPMWLAASACTATFQLAAALEDHQDLRRTATVWGSGWVARGVGIEPRIEASGERRSARGCDRRLAPVAVPLLCSLKPSLLG